MSVKIDLTTGRFVRQAQGYRRVRMMSTNKCTPLRNLGKSLQEGKWRHSVPSLRTDAA